MAVEEHGTDIALATEARLGLLDSSDLQKALEIAREIGTRGEESRTSWKLVAALESQSGSENNFKELAALCGEAALQRSDIERDTTCRKEIDGN